MCSLLQMSLIILIHHVISWDPDCYLVYFDP
jgi:hypothetical protein